MKCRCMRKMMSAFIDDALPPAEKESLASHIQDCGDCMARYKEMLAIHDLIAKAEKHTAPHSFSMKVMAKLEAEKESSCGTAPIRIPLFLKLAEIGFAIVILIVGIISGNILMMNGHGSGKPHGIESFFSLDAFDPAPPDSLGGAYLSITEVHNER